MIKMELQRFGGRGGGSGMSRGGGGRGASEAVSMGGVNSLNGVSAQEAIEGYWNTSWRGDKSDLAKEIVKGEDRFAKEYAEREKSYDQTVVNDYSGRSNLSQWTKDNVLEPARRRLADNNYDRLGREEYNNYIASASADVAKRMGYDTSAYMGVGTVTVKDLRSAMGRSNADSLMRQVKDSAQTAIDSHKRRRNR